MCGAGVQVPSLGPSSPVTLSQPLHPKGGGRENQVTHTCLLSPSGLVLHWLPEAPPTATPRASAVLPSSSPTAVPLPTALHAGQPLLPELHQSGYFNGSSPSQSFRSFCIRQRPRHLIVYTSHDPPSPWCLGDPCSCAPHKGASIQTPPHWTDAAHKVSTARQRVARPPDPLHLQEALVQA